MAEPLELKKTLNLPKTDFSMKANLPQNEPKQLAVWQDEAAAAAGGGLDFHGRVIAQGCLEWLE